MRPTGLFCIAIAAAGCSGKGFSERGGPRSGDALRYAITANPTSLDPGTVQDVDTGELLQNVYEGLVAWGEDNRLVPQLAERWEILDGGRTYIFHLRRNARFHSGRPVTAEDFRWTIDRNLDPAVGSPTAPNYLSEIVGAQDRLQGKSERVSGVEAVDEHTLRIRIDAPRPYFLGKLTYSPAWVIPKEDSLAKRPIRAVEEAIGTGPFRFRSFTPNQTVVLEANMDYYGGSPKVAEIQRPVVLDAATAMGKYRAGQLDLIAVNRQELPGIRRDPQLRDQLRFRPRPAVNYVGMNPSAYPPFRDRRVRRAFVMGVDKRRITEELLGGINQPADGILPPGVLGFREKTAALPFDLGEARRLLAAAGFPNGEGLPQVKIYYREQRPDSRIVAEGVSEQLRRNLGVPCRPQAIEWGTFLQLRNDRKLPMYYLSWYADYLDPENFLSLLFNSTRPNNWMSYRNAEVDRLTSAADVTQDEAARLRMYAQAEDLILQDAPWMPLYFVRDIELVSPRVKGLRANLFGYMPHLQVSLSD